MNQQLIGRTHPEQITHLTALEHLISYYEFKHISKDSTPNTIYAAFGCTHLDSIQIDGPNLFFYEKGFNELLPFIKTGIDISEGINLKDIHRRMVVSEQILNPVRCYLGWNNSQLKSRYSSIIEDPNVASSYWSLYDKLYNCIHKAYLDVHRDERVEEFPNTWTGRGRYDTLYSYASVLLTYWLSNGPKLKYDFEAQGQVMSNSSLYAELFDSIEIASLVREGYRIVEVPGILCIVTPNDIVRTISGDDCTCNELKHICQHKKLAHFYLAHRNLFTSDLDELY